MVQVRFINDTTPIEVTSETQETKIGVRSETQVQTIRVKSSIGSDRHDTLTGRDFPDQHPIGAITGLQDALDSIPTDYVSDAELEAALLEKQDVIRDLSEIRQGAALGATAVQPSDLESYATTQYVDNALNAKANVADIPTATSDLLNDSGFITLSALTPYATQNWVENKGYLTEIPAEYVTDSELTAKGYQTAADVETAITAKGYTTMAAVESKGYITGSALVGYATESYVTSAITNEATIRQNADQNLQGQIDAIVASSDVFDIVGTYAELQAYDISTVPVNDIIKVLVDSTHENAATYYRCVETGGVKSWSYIGTEGAYYTKAQSDARFATSAQGALADTAVQPSDLATVATTGSYNDLLNKPTIPAAQVNSDWNAVSGVAEILNKPSLATVATSGAYSDLSGTPTIPTVNNPTISFTQGGVSKGSITLNQATDQTIALDAGGGGGGSYTAGTGIDITNDVISVTAPTLTNGSTANWGLSLLNTQSYAGCITIGDSARASSSGYSTAVGHQARATGQYSSSLGAYAYATAASAIQLGYGTNSEANSFYVSTSASNNWKMLGSDGKIPAARLPIATSVSSSSTNSETVGAKLFYDTCGDIETLINAL